ncbi:hypothetical protein [Candidatus Lokiarchaeum ossiferum]|uniref:hypothetical protein n=1 Tax=Candidatus Lokiarchaeum ossiferum TaxID=2951803 RepID=UPI00352D7BD4
MVLDDLGLAIRRMFNINFKKQPGESVLFISDYVPVEYITEQNSRKCEMINQRSNFVELLYMRSQDIFSESEVNLIKYPATFQSGKEIPLNVIEMMKSHNIFVALTTYSLTHTDGILEACNNGARGASMPGFTPDMFEVSRPMASDHDKMRVLGEKYINEIIKAKEEDTERQCQVKIQDQSKNCLEFDILGNKRHFRHNFGLFHKPGMSGNLPAGDIHISPDIQENAFGRISIPRVWTKFCHPESEFLTLIFDHGCVSAIEGAKDSLMEFLGFKEGNRSPATEELKLSRRNLAEFGIGLNPFATKHDSLLEAQKILGTCYIGLGTSDTLGGVVKSDTHLNFVIPGANLFINDKQIITNGVPIFK